MRPSYTIEESRPWRWKTQLWTISLSCRINDPDFLGVLCPCVEWEVPSHSPSQSCQTSVEPWILLNKIEDHKSLWSSESNQEWQFTKDKQGKTTLCKEACGAKGAGTGIKKPRFAVQLKTDWVGLRKRDRTNAIRNRRFFLRQSELCLVSHAQKPFLTALPFARGSSWKKLPFSSTSFLCLWKHMLSMLP